MSIIMYVDGVRHHHSKKLLTPLGNQPFDSRTLLERSDFKRPLGVCQSLWYLAHGMEEYRQVVVRCEILGKQCYDLLIRPYSICQASHLSIHQS